MTDNIIDFKTRSENDLIKFTPEFIQNDGFLKLSCFNALEKAGYFVNPKGVKAFQEDNKLEVTGIVDINTLTLLIQVFDNDKIQDILAHFDRAEAKYEEELKAVNKKNSRKGTIIAIVWLFLFGFFEVYGFISAMQDFFGWLDWWK